MDRQAVRKAASQRVSSVTRPASVFLALICLTVLGCGGDKPTQPSGGNPLIGWWLEVDGVEAFHFRLNGTYTQGLYGIGDSLLCQKNLAGHYEVVADHLVWGSGSKAPTSWPFRLENYGSLAPERLYLYDPAAPAEPYWVLAYSPTPPGPVPASCEE